MQRFTFWVLISLVWITVMSPMAGHALDLNLRDVLGLYTGHQVDNKGQYYAYAGATLPLTGTELSFEPFIDVFVARQKYIIKDSVGNLLPAHLNVYTAALGVTKTFDRLSLSLSAGPALQSYTEKYSYQDQGQTVYGETSAKALGYTVSSYAAYTIPDDRFELIASYSSQQGVYFGRTRWKHTVYKKPEWYKMELNPGLEIVAVGNDRFQSYSTGAVLEMKWKRVGILVRGGYQYTTAFHNGQYIGVELFGTPF